MLGKGMDVYVQFASEMKKRVLHKAEVVGSSPGVLQVRLDEDGLAIDAQQEMLIYFDIKQKFAKQSVLVQTVLRETVPQKPDADVRRKAEDEQGPTERITATLQLRGEPVSAESRQCFRVLSVVSDRTAELAGETCKLMDVSAAGFAVLSGNPYKVGQTLEGAIMVDGRKYSGRVCVQSLRGMGRRKTRYGLSCADERTQPGGLREGLPKLSMAIQREQLKRRSGAA